MTKQKIVHYRDTLLGNPFEITSLEGKHRSGQFTVGPITQLIEKPSSMGAADGPWWPSCLNWQELYPDTPDEERYVVTASTDHDVGAGGLWGWTVDDLINPSFVKEIGGGVGPIVDADDLPGSEVSLETPDLLPIFNPGGSLKHVSLLGHAATYGAGVQSTAEFLNTDGNPANFTLTAESPVLEHDTNQYGFIGNALFGYAKRIVINGIEYAYHLSHGDADSHVSVSARRYGTQEKFTLISTRPSHNAADLTYDYYNPVVNNGARIGAQTLFMFRGQLYYVAALSAASAAGGVPVASDVVIGRAEFKNGRFIEKGMPQQLITPTVGTFYEYRAFAPTVVDVDDDAGSFILLFNGFSDVNKADFSIGAAEINVA